MNHRPLARLLGAICLLSALVAPIAALAEEYEPVTDVARQRMDPSPYILGAYGFIWAAVLVYVIMLARGIGRAQAEVEALRRKVEGAGPGAGA